MNDGRHTKGVNVLDLVKTLRSLHKAGQVPKVPERLQPYLKERILVSSWYPLDEFLDIMKLVHRALGGTDREAEMMGEFGAASALGGVHKIFLKPGDPEGTIRAIERVWSGYFDFGECIVRKAKGGDEMVIEGYPDIPRVHGALLVGWLRKAVELSGGDPNAVRLTGGPWQGDPHLSISVRFDE